MPSEEAPQQADAQPLRTLAIDIGGSGLKMLILDEQGEPITERTRKKTPKSGKPEKILKKLHKMSEEHRPFDRVSVGFPGVVEDGVTKNAPNLSNELWADFPLAARLEELLEAPVRAANDADVQGLGSVEGQGVELAITLGTGMGSALFVDGVLVPNLELGHHPGPYDDGSSYEDNLGESTLEEIGQEEWERRLQLALQQMQRTFNPRKIYIGGGNGRLISFELPENIATVSNRAGLYGGIHLWDR